MKKNHVYNWTKSDINLANVLTISRILLIIPLIITIYLGYSNNVYNYVAAVIFLIACVTDFLDGHVARKRNERSSIGAMLDPLADKMLISAALIFLIGTVVHSWMVYAILAREFIITGLRSIASENKKSIPAKLSGKIKTVSQMIAVLFVLLSLPLAYYVMLIATFITIYSGIEYLWIERDLLKNIF